ESGQVASRQVGCGVLQHPPHDLAPGVGKPLRIRAASLMTDRITGGGVTGKQRTGWPLTAPGWVTSSPGEEPGPGRSGRHTTGPAGDDPVTLVRRLLVKAKRCEPPSVDDVSVLSSEVPSPCR